jgi:antitoxin YefM
MRAITYSEARENLKSVIDQVVSDSAPTMIVRRKGQQGAVLISESEWASIEETLHLLRSPANAKALIESIAELDAGKGVERELIGP